MELTAEKREKTGKQAKSLRKSGLIPAVIYGPEMESVSISVPKVKFNKIFDEAGETTLVDLNVDKNSYKVLFKNVQFDPISLNPIHVEFYKPNLLEKINAEIPVEVIGEDTHPLIKSGEAMVLTIIEEIKVEALPTDLPKAFVIDISSLEKVGDSITVAQLEYDHDKVEIVELEPDSMVIKLDSSEMQEEVEETPVSEEEALAGIEATKETAEVEEEDNEGEDKE